MKAVISAGGMGTRLSEETDRIPKPMVLIGGKPILWHIMKLYGSFGINDFVLCLGYKAHVVKEYFHNYFLHGCDVTFDLQAGSDAGAQQPVGTVAGDVDRHRARDHDGRTPKGSGRTSTARSA
jgi:NDP-sugar pyrophosphorylase family protein